MRILLVRTARIKQAITLSEVMFCEPLGLEMVCGALEDAHEVHIFDMMCEKRALEEELERFLPDQVGFTSLCIDVEAVLAGAATVKRWNPSVKVVVGGTQATLNPAAFFHPSVDAVFQSTTAENLQGYFNEGKALPGVLLAEEGFSGPRGVGPNAYLMPKREATAGHRGAYSYFGYRPAALMQISQGCRKACRFCLRWRLEGCQEVEFDAAWVLKDLEGIQEPTVMLYDNDFLGNRQRVERFLDLLATHDIHKNFIAYASVEGILENRDHLEALRQRGFKALLVGYETFSDKELKYYAKKARVEDNLEAASLLKAAGLDVWASFMAHPDWSIKDFKDFRRMVKRLAPEVASVSPLTPFPNLPLFKEFEERLLFPVEDYAKWSFGQVAIRPGRMGLRRYYLEMMKTNLYINLRLNRPTEMLRKYGFRSLLSLSVGALRLFRRYGVQMLRGV